jgi:HAD superfamily hydrolase (TIGR01549 family)
VQSARGVLFDFDGTLYGDWRLWIGLIQVTLQAFQVEVTAHDGLERARRMIDDGSYVNISGVAVALARDQGVDKEQEVRAAFIQKLDEIMDSSGPGDYLLDLLNNLQKENSRLGLVTFMRRPRLMRRLEKWGMTHYFKSIMTPEQWSEFKPSPKPFLKAVEELGLSPSSCYAVGDEPADVKGAKAAGVYAIGLPQGFFSEEELRTAGADRIIQSLLQLPEVMENDGS